MISRLYVMPKKVSTRGNSYLIDSKLSTKELEKLGEAITNPILERYSINNFPEGGLKGSFSYAVEIGFLPGVTDNVGHSVKEIARDLLHKDVNVYTSRIFFFPKSTKDIEKEASALYN